MLPFVEGDNFRTIGVVPSRSWCRDRTHSLISGTRIFFGDFDIVDEEKVGVGHGSLRLSVCDGE